MAMAVLLDESSVTGPVVVSTDVSCVDVRGCVERLPGSTSVTLSVVSSTVLVVVVVAAVVVDEDVVVLVSVL